MVHDDCVSAPALSLSDRVPITSSHRYNRVNGTHASEDPFLLTKILRDEWNYKGLVSSFLPCHFVPTDGVLGHERLVRHLQH